MQFIEVFFRLLLTILRLNSFRSTPFFFNLINFKLHAVIIKVEI